MRKIINKDIAIIGFLILLSAISHWQWFFSYGDLAWGDWGSYLNKEAILAESTAAIAWSIDGLGGANIMASFAPINWLMGLLAYLGASFAVSERLLILIPVAIGLSVGGYLLTLKVTGSRLGAVIGAIIYSYNTYVLILEAGHLFLLMGVAIFPFAFLLYWRYLEEQSLRNAILSALVLLLLSFFDFRMFYIFTFVIIGFSAWNMFIDKNKCSFLQHIKNALRSMIPLALTGVMNAYWIVGIMKLDMITDNEIFSRSLFGEQYLSLPWSLSLFHSFWSGSKLVFFQINEMPWYFIFVPALAFLGFILGRKNPFSVFFGVLAVVGIFFVKQTGRPFNAVYPWLYENFPGFNAFREASKFYVLIALGYAVLIGVFVSRIAPIEFKKKKIGYLIVSLIALLFLYNTKPLISGEYGNLFAPHRADDDYRIFNDILLKENDYSRTFWYPLDSRYGDYDALHPRLSAIDLFAKLPELKVEKTITKVADRIYFPRREIFRNYLSMASVKYVVVPIQDIANDDDFFEYYGGDDNADIHRWYVNQANQISWLKKIDIGTKNLAVYKNENYKPYIFALNELSGFESSDGLDKKFDYLTNEIRSEFSFYDLDENLLPSRKLYIPFESVTPADISNGKIHSTLVDDNHIAQFYVNRENKNVTIRYSGDNMEVSREFRNDISFNGKSINTDGAREILYAGTVDRADYVAGVGSRLIDIKKDKGGLELGIVTEPFDIFALSKDNAIPNASFENGKWSETVEDCNDYDSKSILDMETSNEASEGAMSIQLDATSHIACTGQNNILVESEQSYLFGFDYQSPNAKNAGFYLQFNDGLNTIISEKLPVADADWNTFQKKIEVPRGTTEMDLVVYSYSSDNKTKITTRYDNFKLGALETVATIDPNYEPDFEKVSIPSGDKYEIEYAGPDGSFKNLIKNPSLEAGLWSAEVGDCNNYDSDRQLSMSRSGDAKTDGNYSLQLGARRHIACTSPRLMSVTEGRTYLFSFDYQSPNGKEAGYYLGFNDPEKTAVSEKLPLRDTEWHKFVKRIKVPAGADVVSVTVYAYADDKSKEIINRYDNFSLIELPELEDRYFFATEPQEKFVNPVSVEFESVNPAKKKVHIKGATTSFYLAMSESYQGGWQAQMNNQKIQGVFSKWIPWVKPDQVANDKHFELNGFLNGWYVETKQICADNPACAKNPDGSYDMEMVIEFFPQRWFYLGFVISGAMLLGCLGYLGYDWRKRRKKRGKTAIR